MSQADDASAEMPDLIVPERTSGYVKGNETREAILRTALSIRI